MGKQGAIVKGLLTSRTNGSVHRLDRLHLGAGEKVLHIFGLSEVQANRTSLDFKTEKVVHVLESKTDIKI